MIQDDVGLRSAQRERELAWADALVSIGRAVTTLGLRLRAVDEPKAAARHGQGREVPASVTALAAGAAPRGGLGPRQQQLLSLSGLGSPTGLSPAEVATALNVARANAHRDMKRLEQLGFLVAVPGERPARWRLPEFA